MIKKIAFILVFTPIHVLATIIMVQRFLYNPPTDPGLMERLCRVIGFVLTLPVLLPLLKIDPDGESFLRWIGGLSLVLNGLVWALLLLLFFAAINHRRAAKEGSKKIGTSQPHA